MTIELLQFTCPTCGHSLGEKEYYQVYKEFNEIVDQRVETYAKEQIDKVNKIHEKDVKDIRENYEIKIKNKVEQLTELKIKEIQSQYDKKYAYETSLREEEYKQQIINKNKEIDIIKTQINNDKEEIIEETRRKIELKNKQKESEYKINLYRISTINKDLENKLSQQQKIIDNVPPELKGTASEINLLDELKNAFPMDELTLKVHGREMADVMQSIITENKEKIEPPIVWDKKAGDTVTQKDIDKAKRYKTIHNTDFSIIVTTKGIRSKDSNNSFIDRREDILLVHPSLAVQISKILREFIIQKSTQSKINTGKTSKQIKLYDWIKSSEFNRMIMEVKDKKSKLDDMQRKEEDHHKRIWCERKKIIEDWSECDRFIRERINQILCDSENEETEWNNNEI